MSVEVPATEFGWASSVGTQASSARAAVGSWSLDLADDVAGSRVGGVIKGVAGISLKPRRKLGGVASFPAACCRFAWGRAFER